MAWYDILMSVCSLLGVSGVTLAFWKHIFRRIKKNDLKTEAVNAGVQALLRSQMINEYNKALDRGYAPIYAKENFENMWNKYHNLGANGVMDSIKSEYLNMPSRKEDIQTEAPEN